MASGTELRFLRSVVSATSDDCRIKNLLSGLACFLIILTANNGFAQSVGIIRTIAGPEVFEETTISPFGVAIDRVTSSLFFSDNRNDFIGRITTAGAITTAVVDFDSEDGLAGPQGVARDPAGNTFIADTNNNRILRVSPAGTVTRLAPNTILSFPTGVAVDGVGNVYIADQLTSRILRVTPTGAVTTFAGNGNIGFGGDNGPATASTLNRATDVAVDSAGNVYISDWLNNRVRRVTPAGAISTVAGTGTAGFSGDGGPATAAQLNAPRGLAIDGAGNLLIADFGNSRIRRVTPAGIISTVAGTATFGFSGDGGPATSAQLYGPTGVAVDTAGSLYISDTGNDRIRKVTFVPQAVLPPGANLASAIAGAPYTNSYLTGVTSGTPPLTWLITSGSLPPGLSLSAGTGVISGNPVTAGSYSFTVIVRDGSQISSLPQTYGLSVGTAISPLTLSCSTTLGPTTVGQIYSTACTAAGGIGTYGWSIISGTLPAGLTLSSSGNSATIGGTPTEPGSYNFTLRLTDSSPTPVVMTRSFSGTLVTPVILSCNPAAGPATMTAYTATCTASGGTLPYNWSISPGSLPAGLVLSPSGRSAAISGTPTTSGNYAYTVRVTDSSETPQVATQAYSGTIATPVSLNCVPATGPTAVGVAYSATCTATGGTPSYSWSANPALPAGMNLVPSVSTATSPARSATISGTPTASGAYRYTITVTDANSQTATQTFTGTTAPFSVNCAPPTGTAEIGVAYTVTCTATGGNSPYNWSINPGTLPPGWTLSSSGASATISGTAQVAGDYSYTLRVTDASAQTATLGFTVTIPGIILRCNPATGPVAVRLSYSATCSATGGISPYNWSISPGTLPAGLVLNPTGSSATISGTPTAAGNYSYTVRVTDSGRQTQTATQTYAGAVSDFVPSITIQTGSVPTQPVSVALQLSSATPVALEGTLSITFRPLVAGLPGDYSDPALQFISGGRTMNFTIPERATAANLLQNGAIQTGTVAGEITVTLVRLMAGSSNVVPQPLLSRTVSVPILPPVITPNTLRITNVTGGFNVELTGYSTPRDLTTATFTFAVVSGTQVDGTATFAVDVRSPFAQWYGNSASLAYGSLFRLQVPFTLAGDPNAIQSVTVTLTNSSGTSSPVTGGR